MEAQQFKKKKKKKLAFWRRILLRTEKKRERDSDFFFRPKKFCRYRQTNISTETQSHKYTNYRLA